MRGLSIYAFSPKHWEKSLVNLAHGKSTYTGIWNSYYSPKGAVRYANKISLQRPILVQAVFKVRNKSSLSSSVSKTKNFQFYFPPTTPLCLVLPGLMIMEKFLPTQTVIQTRGIYFISHITIQGGNSV